MAAVLSLLITVAGALALLKLPVSEYPSVVPPTVVVRGTYPGANPKVIAETVAAPLEQQINGVEGLLYMFSQSTSDGLMTLTITFALGTDVDNAQVQVQNRVAQALPRLPQEVQRIGVTTEKASPDLMMVVHLVSPDERYDMLYLSNFAHLQVRDELLRIQGVGSAQVFGAGEYSMRVWLDPDRLSARQLTATDVDPRDPRAEPAGRGRRARRTARAERRDVPAVDQRAGPVDVRGSVQGHHRPRHARWSDHAHPRRRPRRARLESLLAAQPARQPSGGRHRHRAAARLERDRSVVAGPRDDGDAEEVVSGRRRLRDRLRPDDLRARIDPRGRPHALRSHPARRHRRDDLPADVARVDHSARRGAGLADRHVRRDARARLLAQHAVALRHGARDRHRGGRRDCRRGERGASHRAWLDADRGDTKSDG